MNFDQPTKPEKQQAWVIKAVRERTHNPELDETIEAHMEKLGRFLYRSSRREMSEYNFESKHGQAMIDNILLLDSLRRFSEGELSEFDETPDEWFKRKLPGYKNPPTNHLPEDFQRLIFDFYKKLFSDDKLYPNGVNDWVLEAQQIQKEQGKPNQEQIDKLIADYQKMYDETGRGGTGLFSRSTGRDLLFFALGKTVMGYDPKSMSPTLKGLMPIDFVEIWSKTMRLNYLHELQARTQVQEKKQNK
ncbi:MAG: hypothetical protein ACOYUZ_01275 [Patescibacteria group bacterium]